MYAVVSSGGKQYRVEPGGTLVVERLTGEPGAAVTFERVLLLGDGEAVTVGTPIVEGVTVRGTVLGEDRGPKLIVFKYRRKARYRRRAGHRQHLTRVRIDAIEAPGSDPVRSDAAENQESGAEPPRPRRRRKTAGTTED
jgi:large subunit ribosomal protein L21